MATGGPWIVAGPAGTAGVSTRGSGVETFDTDCAPSRDRIPPKTNPTATSENAIGASQPCPSPAWPPSPAKSGISVPVSSRSATAGPTPRLMPVWRRSLTRSNGARRLGGVKAEGTFWTNGRRGLIAKTLANLFLLLIGASATGEVVVGLRWWIKLVVGISIITAGTVSVVVMPDDEDAGRD